MLNWYRTDLHVHTVLSPCGELEMGPLGVIKRCQELGIKILGITDHNNGANVKAFMQVGDMYDITIIPGLELQTKEEVHLLCLFPHLLALNSFEEKIRDTFPVIPNREEVFGLQVIIDAQEEILGFHENLLLVSSSLGVGEAITFVQETGGLVIPSHIERSAYGLLVNLGFIPPDSGFLALEIYDYTKKGDLVKMFPYLQQYTFVVSSDAHQLEALDGEWVTYCYLEEPLFEELVKAFKGESGRKVVILPKNQSP